MHTHRRLRRPTFRLKTLGCKVSRADAVAVARALEGAGFRPALNGERAELCVVCGCAVTSVAEGKSRRAIRRMARENEGALVVAAGCIAAAEGESGSPGALREAGAELLIPPGGTDGILEALRATGRFVPPSPQEGEKESVRPPGMRSAGGDPARLGGWTRAFLKVQDGCDGECAYCIVPALRGAPRSRPVGEVLEEARRLLDAGHIEIVLAGIRLGAYACPETGSRLPELVEELLKLGSAAADPGRAFAAPKPTLGWRGRRRRGLARLRLSSIEPVDFDLRLAELAASSNVLCPHFHLPLQSADDEVLARMNRPYRLRDYRALLGSIRDLVPDASVTTDVIAGFPGDPPAGGETREAHLRTVGFIREAGFARVHAFPFSPRPGTPAHGMPHDPPADVARARARELIEAGRAAAREYRSRFVGRELEVVAEPDGEGRLRGYTERYVTVVFAGPAGLAGSLVRVRATGERDEGLAGEICGE